MSRYGGDDLADDIGGFIGVAIGTAIATAIIIIIIILVMELPRLFQENPPTGDSEASKKSKNMGLIFLITLGISAILFLIPGLAVIAPWPASIGFLLWVLSLEWINVSNEKMPSDDDPSLDDAIAPWRIGSKASAEEKSKPEAADIFR